MNYNYETKARAYHKGFMNCSVSVYSVFKDVNPNYSTAPAPRSEGGKCGAVLASEHVIREMGKDIADFDSQFLSIYGSLKCAELKGGPTGQCNDFVGTAARIAAEAVGAE